MSLPSKQHLILNLQILKWMYWTSSKSIMQSSSTYVARHDVVLYTALSSLLQCCSVLGYSFEVV